VNTCWLVGWLVGWLFLAALCRVGSGQQHVGYIEADWWSTRMCYNIQDTSSQKAIVLHCTFLFYIKVQVKTVLQNILVFHIADDVCMYFISL
jgi:hypothetical protein